MTTEAQRKHESEVAQHDSKIRPSAVFQIIETILPTMHGWTTVEKAQALAATVFALRPEISLEIGIWAGRSLIPMALAHREIGHGMVWGIDPWSPQASADGQTTDPDRQWWGTADHEMIRSQFFEKVSNLGLIAGQHLQIFRQKSDDFDPPENIGILAIDGNHGDQSIRDVDRYAIKVRKGGVVFLDDMQWAGGHVKTAYEHLISLGFNRLYDIGTGCALQRV